MGTFFWIRRAVLVFSVAFVVIAGSQLVRGRAVADSLTHGLLWSVVATGVFIATRVYRSRQGEHCAICQDTPEMVERSAGPHTR